MILNQEQIQEYHEDGFLIFENLLNWIEVNKLREALPNVLSRTGPEDIHEKDGTAVRRV